MGEHVSFLTILAVIITALISLGLPIVVLIYYRKKHHTKMKPFFIGALMFIVFALILETIFHSIITMFFGKTLANNYILYSIYGGLTAALFEEGARFLAMKYILKRNIYKDSAVMYGIGHGGAESILLIGLTYIVNLFVIILVNTGNLNLLLNTVPEEYYDQVYLQFSALWTESFLVFLLAGLERIIAFTLQLSLSYLVYRALKYKNIKYFIVAFISHALVDGVIAYLSLTVNLYIAEVALLVITIPLFIYTYLLYKREKVNNNPELAGIIYDEIVGDLE